MNYTAAGHLSYSFITWKTIWLLNISTLQHNLCLEALLSYKSLLILPLLFSGSQSTALSFCTINSNFFFQINMK
jgi:hypothetical protein